MAKKEKMEDARGRLTLENAKRVMKDGAGNNKTL